MEILVKLWRHQHDKHDIINKPKILALGACYIDNILEKKDHSGNSLTKRRILFIQEPVKGNFEY